METAKDKLKKLTAWDTEPALADAELDELLVQSSAADADGYAPGDAEWAPTYDINAAAAAGWLIKAGRASALTEVDSTGVITSKVFDNCRTMARLYRAKCRWSVRLPIPIE
jgi:hypothetical protein